MWRMPKPKVIQQIKDRGYTDCWKALNHPERAGEESAGQRGGEEICTVWVGDRVLRIDFIFVDKNFLQHFDLKHCRVLEDCRASDHLPVLLEFASK